MDVFAIFFFFFCYFFEQHGRWGGVSKACEMPRKVVDGKKVVVVVLLFSRYAEWYAWT